MKEGGLLVSGWWVLRERWEGRGGRSEDGFYVPDWTDHGFFRAVAVEGVLETASRVSLGSGRAFEFTFSGDGGESGVDMIGC